MDFLTDWLTDWLKELLISGIMGNLSGLFDNVNAQVGEIAVQVGTTPAAWHAGVFSLIRQLSETVILPIAGMVLTFVATYELIQMLLEKNNMHEFDVANIYKWMFKTSCAILILSNTFNIVMAVFDVSQSVIAQSAGLIQGSTDITPDMLTQLETTLEGMDLGPLLGLWLQSSIIGVTMWALNIIIFVLVYGRMIEIYLLTSLSPIPVATLANPGIGTHGPELSALAVRRGIPGDAHSGVRGNLRGACPGDRHRRRSHRGDMGHRWLYGIALLYAVQNGQYLPAHFRRALEGRRVWQNIQPWDKMSRSPRLPRRGCSLWTASRACAPCPNTRLICS